MNDHQTPAVKPPNLLETAHELYLNFKLTPLVGKRPILKGWATGQQPLWENLAKHIENGGNVGLVCGEPSSVVVIDVDGKNGADLDAWNHHETWIVRTGTGLHVYFKLPLDEPITSASGGALGRGVEVKSDGTQVVVPGSKHPDTGRIYEWLPGHSPADQPLADLPDSVLERLREIRQARASNITIPYDLGDPKLVQAATLWIVDNLRALASAPTGTRNSKLNRIAYVAATLTMHKYLAHNEAIQRIRASAEAAGLDPVEVNQTISSALEGAQRKDELNVALNCVVPYVDRIGQDNRQRIQLAKERFSQNVVLIDQALANCDVGLFRRYGKICRLVCGEDPDSAPAIKYIDSLPHLLDRVMRVADVLSFNTQQRGWVPALPDNRLLGAVLERETSAIPTLEAVIRHPTLRPDGTILDEPGYDEKTGLYYHAGNATFDAIPSEITRVDAFKYIDRLKEVLAGFPFVEETDLSVALSAILTPMVRHLMRAAPLHCFTAPAPGTGKSLLVDIASLITTGQPAEHMTYSGYNAASDSESLGKQFFAKLRNAPEICSLDNISRPLNSDALCSILTQPTYCSRILHQSDTETVSTRSTWYANGNSLVIRGDLCRRSLLCRLDAKVEFPEAREFPIDLNKYIPENRHELAVAALAPIAAYLQALGANSRSGNDARNIRDSVKPYGSFTEWSRWVREPLIWCGAGDPCESMPNIYATDPESGSAVDTLEKLYAVFQGGSFSAQQAVDQGVMHPDLNEALLEVASINSGKVNTRKLGWWIRRNIGRLRGGLRVVYDVNYKTRKRYRIESVLHEDTEGGDEPPSNDDWDQFAPLVDGGK